MAAKKERAITKHARRALSEEAQACISKWRRWGESERNSLAQYLGVSTRYASDILKEMKRLSGLAKEDLVKEEPEAQLDLPFEDPKGEEWDGALQFDADYVYNKEDDKYIVYLKAAAKNVVIAGDMHRAMLKAYSNWDGEESTINEICRNFKIPRQWFVEYKTIMGWTHDREPISNEELIERNEEEVIEDLLQQKRFSIYQKFQKASWKETEDAAHKWRKFQAGVLNPFEGFISNFAPRFQDTRKVSKKKENDESTILIGMSDLHFGSTSVSKNLFYTDKDYDIHDTANSILNYCDEILNKLDLRREISNGVITFLGDILDSLTGYTDKGTPLDSFPIGEKQFEIALDTLIQFIEKIAHSLDYLEIYCVGGNHSYYGDYALYKCLQTYFRNSDRIKIVVSTERWLPFIVNNSLFIAEHGYSAFYKSKVPNKGTARDSYVQSLFMAKKDLLANAKYQYFLVGDQHTVEYSESNHFDFIRFPSLQVGSKYADQNNLNARIRQNCLVIGNKGVDEIWHIYPESK